MSTHHDRLPNRIQEEIQIYNMSLPPDVSQTNQQENANTSSYDYEPLLGELLKTAECPVCRCIPSPPIYNCSNGHFTCNSCLPRLPSGKCGYCLAKFTNMRNYPLENLVTVRTFPCDFHNAGCKFTDMSMAEYEEHVRTCSFLPRQPSSKPPQTQTRRILHSKDSNVILQSSSIPELDQQYPCPRCRFANPKRKIKCKNCQTNLRIATPMCGRHVLGGGNMESARMNL